MMYGNQLKTKFNVFNCVTRLRPAVQNRAQKITREIGEERPPRKLVKCRLYIMHESDFR